MEAQSTQPLLKSAILQNLNIWHSCRTVIFRYALYLQIEQVKGISIMETVPAPEGAPYPWLIDLIYYEYNSGALLVNDGIFIPTCS